MNQSTNDNPVARDFVLKLPFPPSPRDLRAYLQEIQRLSATQPSYSAEMLQEQVEVVLRLAYRALRENAANLPRKTRWTSDMCPVLLLEPGKPGLEFGRPA